MESSSHVILTNSNYFQWKSHMEYLLRSKGLYRITLGTKYAPDEESKLAKWNNKDDSYSSLIGMPFL